MVKGSRFAAAAAAAIAAIASAGIATSASAAAAGGASHPAAAATGCSSRAVQAKPAGTDSLLLGVDVLSKCDAWAVGGNDHGTVIEHWTGRAWKRMKVSDHQATLHGVAAPTTTRAWAAGYYYAGSNAQPVIVSWAGHGWTNVTVPDPGGAADSNELSAIAASSTGNAWAVGFSVSAKGQLPFTLHYAHGKWHHVYCPLPAGGSHALLNGVAIEPDGTVWAVGQYITGGAFTNLFEHWANGKWHPVSVPGPSDAELQAVSAAGAGRTYAAGTDYSGTYSQPLTYEYRSGTWKQLKTPALAEGGELSGVTATGWNSAWAVGYAETTTGARTIILSWNGHHWSQLKPKPASSAGSDLTAVSGSSCGNLWAVGWSDYSVFLAERC
jgi:hypothetical protein